jgi:hypothetical protein
MIVSGRAHQIRLCGLSPTIFPSTAKSCTDLVPEGGRQHGNHVIASGRSILRTLGTR